MIQIIAKNKKKINNKHGETQTNLKKLEDN